MKGSDAQTLLRLRRENVAEIITFGTMKAKAGVRDVGRVLNQDDGNDAEIEAVVEGPAAFVTGHVTVCG